MKTIKIIMLLVVVAVVMMSLTACREADIVNHNLSKAADYFECERRITVYNARTDTIIFECEGYMSLSNSRDDELTVTLKTGANSYKKNYVYLNDNVVYAVEDITGTHTDPYHYSWTWHTEIPLSVEFRK